MRILITGGFGFIGSHLCARLVREGADVTVVDPVVPDDAWFQQCQHQLGTLTGSYMDILSTPDILTHVFYEQDCVIHLAARAGVRASVDNPRRYARTNVEGTTSVLEACRKAGVAKVLFASSSSVYGAPTPLVVPSSETDPVHPMSPYGVSKVAGELLCEAYAHLYGMQIACMRLFSVYGPRQRTDLAIPTFATALVKGRPLTIYGDGSSTRDYTYVDDVVDGFCAAIRWLNTAAAPGHCEIFNLGSGAPVALRTVVAALAHRLAPHGASIDYTTAHRADVEATWASLLKSQMVLGWSPMVGFADGLERYVDWFLT